MWRCTVPRHDLDVISLIAVVGFGGLGLVNVLNDAGIASRWAWPVLLIVAGVVGLLASGRGDRPGGSNT